MTRVTVKQPLPASVYQDEATPPFEQEGIEIWATVQPFSASVRATQYGEESGRMLLMLTRSAVALSEGMGVCVEGVDGTCDYRIAAPVEKWGTHARVLLKQL